MSNRRAYRWLKVEFEALNAVVSKRDKQGVEFLFPSGKRRYIYFHIDDRNAVSEVRDIRRSLGLSIVRLGGLKPQRPPRIDLARLVVSRHASERLKLMRSQQRIETDEIIATLTSPWRVVYSRRHCSWVWLGQQVALAMAVEDGVPTIKTVLWANEETWEENPRPEHERRTA